MKSWRFSRSGWRPYPFFFLLVVAAVSQACVAGTSVARRPTAELESSGSAPAVAWFAPVLSGDNQSLDRWRKNVGPPITPPLAIDERAHDAITVVSWNTAVGDADVVSFVRSLPRLEPSAGVAAAGGLSRRTCSAVATRTQVRIRWATRRRRPGRRKRWTSARVGRVLRAFNAEWGPHITGGSRKRYSLESSPDRSPGDRVAVRASAAGRDRGNDCGIRSSSGAPWNLRVVSAHLDNLGSIKRAWIASEYRSSTTGPRPGRAPAKRSAHDTRGRLQHVVWLRGSGVHRDGACVSRDACHRSPPNVPWRASARPRVLSPGARLASGRSPEFIALRLRPLSSRRLTSVQLI